eukprot:m.53011 g.53011  ORF g.53011 m.53011 type:complete len:164 (-) comp12345_c0_seq4:1005-1496(-)
MAAAAAREAVTQWPLLAGEVLSDGVEPANDPVRGWHLRARLALAEADTVLQARGYHVDPCGGGAPAASAQEGGPSEELKLLWTALTETATSPLGQALWQRLQASVSPQTLADAVPAHLARFQEEAPALQQVLQAFQQWHMEVSVRRHFSAATFILQSCVMCTN